MNMEEIASDCLRQFGADVKRIPTGADKSADLLVEWEGCKVLVEVKEKRETEEWLKGRREKLDAGDLFSWQKAVTPSNRLSGIVGEAVKQLSSPSRPDHDFRVLWFGAGGPRAEAKIGQLRQTLYGLQSFVSLSVEHLLHCYYFHNSEFYRHRQSLDGVVRARVEGTSVECRLHVNTISDNHSSFVWSPFYAAFRGAVEDPSSFSVENGRLILDADADRSDPGACIRLLQEKYRLDHLQSMNLGHIAAEVRVGPGEGH